MNPQRVPRQIHNRKEHSETLQVILLVPAHSQGITNVYQQKGPKTKNYSTPYSHVVTHHSTDGAITSLTSEIRRDPVHSGMYGRS